MKADKTKESEVTVETKQLSEMVSQSIQRIDNHIKTLQQERHGIIAIYLSGVVDVTKVSNYEVSEDAKSITLTYAE